MPGNTDNLRKAAAARTAEAAARAENALVAMIKKDSHGPLRGSTVADGNWVPSRRWHAAVRRRPGFCLCSGGGGRAGRCTVVLACRPSSPIAFGPFVAVRKFGAGAPCRVTPAASA